MVRGWLCDWGRSTKKLNVAQMSLIYPAFVSFLSDPTASIHPCDVSFLRYWPRRNSTAAQRATAAAATPTTTMATRKTGNAKSREREQREAAALRR